jgi:2-hydroxy-3-keto-5-methylthiopentenyl-1-phosphate phosphatase
MGKIKVNSSKDEIIENIRAAHIKNRLTMFVGASLSYISGSKKWIELIHDMQSEMGEPLNKDIGFDEMIKIPQIFDNFLKNDQDRFLAFVSSSLGIENIKPNLCHSLIMQLAPKKIITTNFDNLLEDAASDALMTYKTIAKDEDIDGIDGSPIILKVHGDIRSQNIVLTEVDFLNYEDNFKLISTILKASFATDLVLIIGYSIRDANIKRILNSTEKVLKSKLRKPYFIHVEDSEIEERDYEYYQSLGVEIIDYKVFCEKQNTYEDKFTTILNEIIKFCTNKNYSIYKTGDDPIDFLYSRLELLDNFCVLRLNDIVEALKPHVRNDSGSILSLRETDDDFFEVFNDFLIDSKKSKNENTSKKIKLIESVLKKSGFIGYYYNKIHLFNYKLDSMVGRAYNFIDFLEFDIMVGDDQIGLSEKLKKGYYLCKFQEYERAIELFESVASDAFKRREYVYYLIAQSNRKFAYKLGTIYFSKDFMNVEKNKLWSDYFSNRSTHLIESLPVQAQDKLKPMFDFGSAQINKLSSEVYLLAQQLLSDTVKNVVYFGESTFEKMSRKIIEIERFAKENYLIEDSFKEHHEIIRNSMINLMIRHASTKYERITEGYLMDFPFLSQARDSVIFISIS